MRLRRLLLVALALGAVWAQTARADDPAAAMYDPSTVDVIKLTLPKPSEEALKEHPTDDYVEGTLEVVETDGAPGTEGAVLVPAMTVGIRLKGNVGGSFRDLTEKAAFKIKCNFVKGVKCLGLKKMTLNNMVQDPSMVHETLAYAAFRAAGVPASRTGFAYVRVNGQDSASTSTSRPLTTSP
jgi:spore coat protein CotH